MRNAFYLLALLWVTSCASPQNSSPEGRLAEATTGPEAVQICADSRISDKPSVEVAQIRVWTRCIELAIRRYPALRENEDLAELFHELSKTEGDPRTSEDRKLSGSGMNAAVAAAFAGILAELGHRAYTLSPDQMNAIHANLPGYFSYLEALN